MSEGSGSGRISAWVGAAAGAVSAIVALLTAYQVRFEAGPSLVWSTVSIAQAAMIVMLAVLLLRRKPITLPRGIRARNRRMLESLFESISNDFKSQVTELSKSQLSLYGRHVRNAQVHLLGALAQEHGSPQVRATDIVRRLDLWPTRGVYLQANKNFITDGGQTRRIFLISADLINDFDEAKAFWRIMETHREMGIDVRLHVLDVLDAECAEDYVIYARDCVLVEIEQGDVDFSRGKVTVYFDPITIDSYIRRFEYLDMANDTRSSAEVYRLYRKYFVDGADWSGRDGFAERKAVFLNEIR